MRDRRGGDPWIMMFAESMQRVEWPGLDLLHLYAYLLGMNSEIELA